MIASPFFIKIECISETLELKSIAPATDLPEVESGDCNDQIRKIDHGDKCGRQRRNRLLRKSIKTDFKASNEYSTVVVVAEALYQSTKGVKVVIVKLNASI